MSMKRAYQISNYKRMINREQHMLLLKNEMSTHEIF